MSAVKLAAYSNAAGTAELLLTDRAYLVRVDRTESSSYERSIPRMAPIEPSMGYAHQTALEQASLDAWHTARRAYTDACVDLGHVDSFETIISAGAA